MHARDATDPMATGPKADERRNEAGGITRVLNV
jgi:hypothetical protein